eukprot:TRINITY_DN5558_c0_g1_i1.p1 TRINITY_DN5558_c0_g1~~TRINITY_DN5558_c0_g1_i1.p1  ORF type:complete len:312 (-),score=99.57 TRINITY_DN5558_c0_g1_i1:181-1059(-)
MLAPPPESQTPAIEAEKAAAAVEDGKGAVESPVAVPVGSLHGKEVEGNYVEEESLPQLPTVMSRDEQVAELQKIVKEEQKKEEEEQGKGLASVLMIALKSPTNPVLLQLQKVEMGLSKLWKFLHLTDILQPPVVASLLALVLGCIPATKSLMFTDSAPLAFFVGSIDVLGGAMIPCIMLVLGGNLVSGPASSRLGTKTTVAITFTRLVITPLFGLIVVSLAEWFRFLPANDPMFRFVLLLQQSMPTSILAGALATMRGHGSMEASAVLFWEHVLAIFSMAAWLLIFLNFLSL